MMTAATRPQPHTDAFDRLALVPRPLTGATAMLRRVVDAHAQRGDGRRVSVAGFQSSI